MSVSSPTYSLLRSLLEVGGLHLENAETLDAVIESSGFVLKQTTKSDFDAGRSLFRRYESLS